MKKVVVLCICLFVALPALAKNDKEKKNKHKSLPPGLQKKLDRGGELPPGWQKKVKRGEVLDDDLYDYGEVIADEKTLPGYPKDAPGTEIIRIHEKIIRIKKDTREILDIFAGKSEV